jgi:branched-chain amino acid transport system ATP-binding protein
MTNGHDIGVGLEVDDITVRFGGLQALTTVNVSAVAGRTCGIIGPNGAGKSTLLDVVSGLCAPASGMVRLGGHDITRMSPVKRARAGLRRTFQRPQSFGGLTVMDNVLVAIAKRGGGGDGGLATNLLRRPRQAWHQRARAERARHERAAAVLDMCGLRGQRGACPAELPIGAQRMVELARAIVDEPSVLLLDEPTSGLDAEQTEKLAAIIAGLDATILLVEHDMEFVMRTCERIAVLDAGSIIGDGVPTQVLASPAVRAAYLG